MMSGADPIDSVVDLDRSPSSRPFVLALHECDEGSRPIVGTKAFNLARFSRADFPVPPGVVVTSEAFSRWLALLGEPLDAERAAHSPVPSDVEQAVLEAVRTLGDGPLAVRSSSIAEDLAEASFAGQYETVLGVQGQEAIQAAVVRCWSSSLTGPAQAYRGTSGAVRTEEPDAPTRRHAEGSPVEGHYGP